MDNEKLTDAERKQAAMQAVVTAAQAKVATWNQDQEDFMMQHWLPEDRNLFLAVKALRVVR